MEVFCHWMSGDRFSIVGLFFEKQIGKVLIQSEYYNAAHDAVRNSESVLNVIQNADVNTTQRNRFLKSNANLPNDLLTPDDVRTDAKYNVQTWYVRRGYNIQTRIGQFVPYVFPDRMGHPEAIQSKSWGGDDEAGFADDGIFWNPRQG